MQLIIPADLAERLHLELKGAGRREMGGILMGQNVGPDVFKLIEMTFQRSGGRHACFSRSSALHDRALKKFFDRTGHQYTDFNYIGEWHSHPSFALRPSDIDHATMMTLVRRDMEVNFALLLLVKLGTDEQLEYETYVYSGARPPGRIEVAVEQGCDAVAQDQGRRVPAWLRWLGL
jgi:hypothetical protein